MLTSEALRPPVSRLHALPPLFNAPPFVGESEAIRTLLRRADQLARTEVPLLLHGESGTGKEVLARRIHAGSRRAAGPFVAENCAAIPAELFESELFGHARGAFTGADRAREGLLRLASGGTLLLDEVGEMPLELQAKLLRVLDQGCVRPVGSSSEVAVDVRVLSATNRNLTELVRDGRFREDLFYRLQGARLVIPPLRERPEDVVELAEHFLAALNRDHRTALRFAPDQLRQLAECPWYGNARELRNAVHLAYVTSEGETIEVAGPDRAAPERPAQGGGLVNRVAPLEDIEREAILMALDEARGNRRQAADRLGISRSSIYERIRRLAIDAQRPAACPV